MYIFKRLSQRKKIFFYYGWLLSQPCFKHLSDEIIAFLKRDSS